MHARATKNFFFRATSRSTAYSYRRSGKPQFTSWHVYIMVRLRKTWPLLVQKGNATAILGLTTLQKVDATYLMSAYGFAVDSLDDYVRIRKSTFVKSLTRFMVAC